MILYHGTNMTFDTILLAKGRRYKDFGQGFYLTDIRRQALQMAQKKADLFGGTPVVLSYEFDEKLLHSDELNVKIFRKYSAAWASFVDKCRDKDLNYHHDYDVVYGPVADDGVAYQLARKKEGTLTLKELAKALRYKKAVCNQYFFGTEKAISCLKRIK